MEPSEALPWAAEQLQVADKVNAGSRAKSAMSRLSVASRSNVLMLHSGRGDRQTYHLKATEAVGPVNVSRSIGLFEAKS